MNISAEKSQLTLDFTPGLLDRHRNLLDCVGASIYKRGLSTCAIDLNESPGNLSNQLSEDSPRKFCVLDLEKHLEKSGDYSPIYYLIEKFLHKPEIKASAALSELPQAIAHMQQLMKQAGLS